MGLFTNHKIFTKTEIYSRYEILLENYCKTLHIETKTLADMVKRDFFPAVMTYTDTVTDSILKKKEAAGLACASETRLLTKLSGYYDQISGLERALEDYTKTAEGIEAFQKQADYYHGTVIPAMEEIRRYADAAEEYFPDDVLPYPNYQKLLFSV